MNEDKLLEIYKELNNSYNEVEISLKAKEIQDSEKEINKDEIEKNNNIIDPLYKLLNSFFENTDTSEEKINFCEVPEDILKEINDNGNKNAKILMEIFDKEKEKIIELAKLVKALKDRNNELLMEVGKIKFENLKLEKLNNVLLKEHNVIKKLDDLNLD